MWAVSPMCTCLMSRTRLFTLVSEIALVGSWVSTYRHPLCVSKTSRSSDNIVNDVNVTRVSGFVKGAGDVGRETG